MNKKLANVSYKLVSSLTAIEFAGKLEKLDKQLEEKGYTPEKLQGMMSFIEGEVTNEEFSNAVEEKAFDEYFESLSQLEKYISMAQGYQAMADINLEIAEEELHLEEEGEKLVNEVVTTNSKENATA